MVCPANFSCRWLTSPRLLKGIFFTLFVITTVVMTHNVTERVRRQRKMILPMSFAMLLVATVV